MKTIKTREEDLKKNKLINQLLLEDQRKKYISFGDVYIDIIIEGDKILYQNKIK